MITYAKPMALRGGEIIAVHPHTGESGRWPVTAPPVQYGDCAEIPTGDGWLVAGVHEDLTLVTSARQDVIAGLRALCDWLEAHPDIPVRAQQEILYAAGRGRAKSEAVAEVDQLAALIGVQAAQSSPRAYRATKRFGPVNFEVIAFTPDAA